MSELQLTTHEQAHYLYALRLLPGIGPQSVLVLSKKLIKDGKVSLLPTIPHMSAEELRSIFGLSLAQKLRATIDGLWEECYRAALSMIDQHLEKGIHPLPITSNEYPILLRQIKDAPFILYAKGDISVLNNMYAVAVVGTREPTQHGFEMARLIANNCARHGCVIVSGLAKGIDTAAHQGAIDAGGKTVAVFATPLDQVYPAANKKLADTICKEAGVLVSELPLGMQSWKGAFVQRDRIQSGLSLGVIAVQTDIEGGTMHTVRFAEEQKRLCFCPPPADEETKAKQNRGIHLLIDQKKAFRFPTDYKGIYERLLERLDDQRKVLISPKEEALLPTQQVPLTEQQPELAASLPKRESQLVRVAEKRVEYVATPQQSGEQVEVEPLPSAEQTPGRVQAASTDEVDESGPEMLDTPTPEAPLTTDATAQASSLAETGITPAKTAMPGEGERENHGQPLLAISRAKLVYAAQQNTEPGDEESTATNPEANGISLIRQKAQSLEPSQAEAVQATDLSEHEPIRSVSLPLVNETPERESTTASTTKSTGRGKGSKASRSGKPKRTTMETKTKSAKQTSRKKDQKVALQAADLLSSEPKANLFSLLQATEEGSE